MISEVCGFDQWTDNNYAYDGLGPEKNPKNFLNVFKDHAESMNLPYRWWKEEEGLVSIYIVDPTGFGA